MPEGPEIRLAADRIARVLVGQTITDIEFGLPRLRRFRKRLVGTKVTAVDTRCKAMLSRFGNGLAMYSHNLLYGRWYAVRRPLLPDTRRQLRVALHTETHSALLYSASDIEILTDRQLARHPFLLRLGPDILDRELDADSIAARLEQSRFRNRALGALYLDQAFLAGVGNYLRSEILWHSGLGPWHRPSALDDADRRRLGRSTIAISRRSYRTRGVTVAPSLAQALRQEGQGYDGYRFYVFGREGLPCRECGTRIERQLMGSRSIFVCTTCQPR